MLSDYIEAYKEALKNKDKKQQEKIERDLAKLGMDRFTLQILAKEDLK